MSPPWLAVLIAAGLLFYPILGNMRPDKVSFLPSLRQYAGNWASAVWAFAPGAEVKLDRVTRSAQNRVNQFVAFGYEPAWAEVTTQKTIAWRSMHSQGRGLFSLLLTHLPDIEPGECVIAWVESEAVGSGVQHCRVIDAALGVIECGTWKVADAVDEQPWLPNSPIPLQVEWSLRAGALA